MKTYFERMLDYNHWANTRYIQALKSNQEFADYPQCLKLMSHLINAAEIWLKRIEQSRTELSVWQEHELADLEVLEAKGFADWTRYLSVLKSVDETKIVMYQNTQGVAFQNSTQDILTHVFNHGTYHRGQVAKIMVAAGLKPPVTDFIAFTRE